LKNDKKLFLKGKIKGSYSSKYYLAALALNLLNKDFVVVDKLINSNTSLWLKNET